MKDEPKPTEPEAATAAVRPVVFLNPVAMIEPYRVGLSQETKIAVGGFVSLRDQPAEAITGLCTSIGAELVCTNDLRNGFDLRTWIMDRIKADLASEWFVCPEYGERRRVAANWLARRDNPPAIVIDRPAPPNLSPGSWSGGGKVVNIAVPDTHKLSVAHCQEAARQLAGALATRTHIATVRSAA